MRILVWNMRRATYKSDEVWDYFQEIDPDVALLQEVGSLPESLSRDYALVQRNAYAGNGNQQRFSTCLLVNGSVISQLQFSTPWDWVNEELENFAGNLVGAEISVQNDMTFRAISVYSPAWPKFDRQRLNEVDATDIKLKNNPDVCLTEILWAAL